MTVRRLKLGFCCCYQLYILFSSVPLIKAEPDELEDEALYLKASSGVSKAGSSVLKIKEDKENKRPASDMEGEPENEEVEEEEEDLENISMPSNPRPPPPKPKGRPHRIRDSGTQTVS